MRMIVAILLFYDPGNDSPGLDSIIRRLCYDVEQYLPDNVGLNYSRVLVVGTDDY